MDTATHENTSTNQGTAIKSKYNLSADKLEEVIRTSKRLSDWLRVSTRTTHERLIEPFTI